MDGRIPHCLTTQIQIDKGGLHKLGLAGWGEQEPHGRSRKRYVRKIRLLGIACLD